MGQRGSQRTGGFAQKMGTRGLRVTLRVLILETRVEKANKTRGLSFDDNGRVGLSPFSFTGRGFFALFGRFGFYHGLSNKGSAGDRRFF